MKTSKRGCSTASDSDRVKTGKRASENQPPKISKNRRSHRAESGSSRAESSTEPPVGPPWTAAKLLKRFLEDPNRRFPSKPPRIHIDDYLKLPKTKALIAWYDNMVYAPTRRIEQRLRAEDERLRVENRILNLRWRLDAIESEFDHICKELDFIIKIVMHSYGCHRHRGEWRRRHSVKRKREEQRILQNKDFLRARHVAKHGPRRRVHSWDYYLHPDSRTPQTPSASAVSSPTAPPSAVQEGSTFSRQPKYDSLFPAAAPPPPSDSPAANNNAEPNSAAPTPPRPLPPWSELPYNPPCNPLFVRAMDGTTFTTPRPHPPERQTWAPYVRPKRRRRPSERQVRKLYEDFLLNDDPPPPKGAGRYTDIRIFLAELNPSAWQRYGPYFYDFFKRRLPPDLRKRRRKKKPKPPRLEPRGPK